MNYGDLYHHFKKNDLKHKLNKIRLKFYIFHLQCHKIELESFNLLKC